MRTARTIRGLVLGLGAAALMSGAAMAADVLVKKAPPPAPAATPTWDIAFGGLVMSDYNFRGVSQSNRGPSGGAYFEPQFTTTFGTLYVGLAGTAIDWPANLGFSSPSAEIDLYGGWRNTWGAFSLDLGLIYYYYPREQLGIESDFWEIYAKGSFAVTPDLTVGANIFYTPDLLNYGAVLGGNVPGTYVSLTGKYVLPWKNGDLGAFISGELGHWFLGNIIPDYTYFNAGLAFTMKALTLDLRFHGTDLSQANCATFLLAAGGVANPASRWCGDTFIVSAKFDTTYNALK
jgi:uncharacterized protein (TIGR02001 family)